MPSSEGRPAGQAIHATAVAIAGQGLVILGPSRAGKSRLALGLIESEKLASTVCLIGDDRILLAESGGRLVARPHPRIAGFIERRGLGIVATPHVDEAPVAAVVALGPTTAIPAPLQNFPCLRLVTWSDGTPDAVLKWWRGASTTPAGETSICGR